MPRTNAATCEVQPRKTGCEKQTLGLALQPPPVEALAMTRREDNVEVLPLPTAC
jgi:hypothetical protein